MNLDLAIGGWEGNASQSPSFFHLVFIKEGLFLLVNFSTFDLSDACRAGSGTATVRKVDSGFLGGICVVINIDFTIIVIVRNMSVYANKNLQRVRLFEGNRI